MNSTSDIESLPIVRGASDLHGLLPVVEPCDVLLLAGDLVPLDFQNNLELSERWLADVFARWLDGVPATEVVGIAGNHDFALERLVDRGAHRSLFGARWTYLRDAGVTLECGLKIWGTPWSPGSSEWAFSSDEQTLADAFEGIPDHVDVLLSHTPPYGKGDRAPRLPDPLAGQLKDWRHIGSTALQGAIHRTRPWLAATDMCTRTEAGGSTRTACGMATSACLTRPIDSCARRANRCSLFASRLIDLARVS